MSYPAAVVTGSHTQDYADYGGERDGADTHDHGYARADYDPAEQVSPNVVGPQGVGKRGSFEQRVVLGLWIVRGG